jgi:hypothetical protein
VGPQNLDDGGPLSVHCSILCDYHSQSGWLFRRYLCSHLLFLPPVSRVQTDRRGGGEEPNKTTGEETIGLFLYIPFSPSPFYVGQVDVGKPYKESPEVPVLVAPRVPMVHFPRNSSLLRTVCTVYTA